MEAQSSRMFFFRLKPRVSKGLVLRQICFPFMRPLYGREWKTRAYAWRLAYDDCGLRHRSSPVSAVMAAPHKTVAKHVAYRRIFDGTLRFLRPRAGR